MHQFALRDRHHVSGAVTIVIVAAILALLYGQFRGDFLDTTPLTVISDRSGLAMDVGSKVTFNGVKIGRVTRVQAETTTDVVRARITLAVDSEYLKAIPDNVQAAIKASTVFGSKYVALDSPSQPQRVRIAGDGVIEASSVTTEYDTLFANLVGVAEKVDPIKLNQTLAASAQALDGLGERFGRALLQGNDLLGDLNPRMDQVAQDFRRLADLSDTYAGASPDLFGGLQEATTTAATLNQQKYNLDQALMSAIGFANAGGDIIDRASPYWIRGSADLVPTSALLDKYSPSLLCSIRNFHDVQPKIAAAMGGNGYSTRTTTEVVGAGNPYVYPDNLPRVNASGGPEGRPGCWQPITRDLWPAPYLVMDTGASIAPYNHLGLGQPLAIEYIWGRQIGENTINP